ncbi:WG repeat-containing protein [Leptothoe spongobia TAU-MAC 1115]|uniref:WG repeat-containing protein n=2 Tax=Leptothoe TaxID=2651725 RepID=A0A947GN18_9CYAN|nr:WG repeat-containing protein [Leptothoe spongobia TAU-MAC 1115]
MEVDGWFGYIDNTGKSVIPAQFSQIRTRSDGFIQVNLGSKLVCRETGGDSPQNRCRFKGGKWGLL